MIRLVAAFAFCALLSACAQPVSTTPGGVHTQSGRTGYATKAVATKRAPETLLANDGTICRVSPDRFRDTRVGARVSCNWQ